MRIALALPFALACVLAGAAVAQTTTPSADIHAQTVSTAAVSQTIEPSQAPAKAQNDNPEAAAALALSIRHREEEDQRIARIACAAGDTSKCPAAAMTSTARSPSS